MRPSRRDLIASFLGLPALVTTGCHSDSVPPLPPGEIVGPSSELGHRLRDGWRPVPATDAWERHGTVIVGGGVAGLAAAWRLARAGVTDFVLLELEPVIGGTARGGDSAAGPHPWGAHYVPAPLADNTLLITLLDEMGVIVGREPDGTPVIAEEVLCRDPQERLFFRGRWYEGLYLHAGESAEDAEQFRRFNAELGRWAEWKDGRGRKAFAIPVANGSDDPVVTELDRITMSEWLDRNGFTSSRVRWLADYACRDDYGMTAEQASAWAGIFYFAARMKSASSPAQPLMTWPEGNARLVSHLFGKVKDRVRAGWAAADVNLTPAGVEVVAISHDGLAIRGLRADRVIFAAPQFLARYLIRPFRTQLPAHLASFNYGAWMVANLHLSDRPADRGFPLSWDNVLYESPSLGYVVNTHQRGVDHGQVVFTYYYPLTDPDPRLARTKLLGAGRDEWADVTLTDLTMAHPDIRSLTTRLDVMRWGHAMVRPAPGFVWGQHRRKAAAPFRGVHFAGADLSGIPIFEEALLHGVRAAEEVLGERGVKFERMVRTD
ncbi:MAG TPA: FAD-dependent oxidoreductase [Gemmataceae bacterium]|nr:FAD-dependent oxidoreductase [Gemmataceae bacterium]